MSTIGNIRSFLAARQFHLVIDQMTGRPPLAATVIVVVVVGLRTHHTSQSLYM